MWTFIKERQLWKPGAGILLGGLAGFGYYYFIGCAVGTCPIQSNPVLMTGYGVVFGLILGIPGKKKSEDSREE